MHFGARPRVPPGCCGGRHLERGVQEAVKTPVKQDSLFGDVPDLDSGKAAEITKEREKWKSFRSLKRC